VGDAEVDPAGSPDVVIADAIVVAAGSSSRMDGRDKLMAPLAGRPLLAWSLEAIRRAPGVRHVVLVVAQGREGVAAAAFGSLVATIVVGGEDRGASVAAGLAALERLWAAGGGDGSADPVVLVHDGARPLATTILVSAVISATAEHGAAIPVVPVVDTLKHLVGGRVGSTVDRSDLVASQTPQGARASLLRRAFGTFPASGERRFTDEAALLEACTIPVHPIPGDPVNLKVTVPADLARAEAILGREATTRVGLGSDSHPFGPGEPLRLGGVEIPGAPRLHGHSDGDVALHAIADALLGAAALGDLGRQFPPDRRTPRGIGSGDMLRAVVARLAEAGWRPGSVDLTITGSRPRLAPFVDAMRAAVATAVGLSIEAVSVKASTGNLDGAEGAGRVLSAAAIVSVVQAR
jgi:2-C-methyl-D-erythritol 4-phosphate cytidylyltransferase/2-C-methyl-D-erythritol 2,4-cyclodiphosphate synthase